jgi:hypothetical protein
MRTAWQSVFAIENRGTLSSSYKWNQTSQVRLHDKNVYMSLGSFLFFPNTLVATVGTNIHFSLQKLT